MRPLRTIIVSVVVIACTVQFGAAGSTVAAATASAQGGGSRSGGGEPKVDRTVLSNLLYQYSQNYEPFTKLTRVSAKVFRWSDLAPFMGPNRHLFPQNEILYGVLQTGQANPTKNGRPRTYWQLQLIESTSTTPLALSNFYIRGPNYLYVWGTPARQPSYWSILPGPEYVLNLKTGVVGQAKNQLPPTPGRLI